MRGIAVRVTIVVFAVFLLSDDPIGQASQIVGEAWRAARGNAAAEGEFRQADRSLKVAISRDDRREGRRVGVLLEDWLYCDPRSGDVYLVPRGYVTDFASIPWPASMIFNPFGNHIEAAVAHDWLYAVGEPGERAEADGLFRFAMAEQGVNALRRFIMWGATRAGGAGSYGDKEEWRFWDSDQFVPIEPPLAKPDKAAVTTIDCRRLAFERERILATYGTRERAGGER